MNDAAYHRSHPLTLITAQRSTDVTRRLYSVVR